MVRLRNPTHTYMFADLANSTTQLARGDSNITEAMAAMPELMERARSEWSAVSTSFTGDGFLAAFPDANDATSFAVAVMKWASNPSGGQSTIDPVALRIGMHTGPPDRILAVSHIGLVPSIAARVCDAAHPGQIVLSGSTKAALTTLPSGVEFSHLGRYRLPGDLRGTDLWSLIGDGLVRTVTPAGDLDRLDPAPAWWAVQNKEELDLVIAELEAIAGITEAKNEVIAFLERAELAMSSRAGPAPLPLDMDMVFMGPRGTGKSLVASLLAQALVHLGVLTRQEVQSIDAIEFGRLDLDEARSRLVEARGALVLITNTDRLAVLIEEDIVAASLYAGPFTQLVESLHQQREYGLTNRLPPHERLFVTVSLRNHENLDRLRAWHAGIEELYGRRITFQPLDHDELVDVFRRHSRLAGFAIDDRGKEVLGRIVADPQRGLDSARAMIWLFDQARLNFEVRHARISHPDQRTGASPSPRVLTGSDIDWTPPAIA